MNTEKLYSEYLGQRGCASDRVIVARKALNEAFEEYICAIEEFEFNSVIEFMQKK